MTTPRPVQPLVHGENILLLAPSQAWSATDGQLGAKPIHGFYYADTRAISEIVVRVSGTELEHIATAVESASSASFVSLLRGLDDEAADPRVRLIRTRTVEAAGVSERLTIQSALDAELTTAIDIELVADFSASHVVKAGLRTETPAPTAEIDGETARWSRDGFVLGLLAPGATISAIEASGRHAAAEAGGGARLHWPITVPAGGEVTVDWSVSFSDSSAVVTAAGGRAEWSGAAITTGEQRLDRWLEHALADLEALRMVTSAHPDLPFLAAGAPWFFTLFGRDSIWAARLMLPFGSEVAATTARLLAAMQGQQTVADSAEQPGKIMHELRPQVLTIPGENIALPPLYYGTIDATPLWISLVHDAWRAGMPEHEVEALLPQLDAALGWMRDYGDADGDGLLEYVDTTGHGLANQGWKDSGDSVQWKDGNLASGPIALCEVQGYAYRAALDGAVLLELFGRDGSVWRDWAAQLKRRFAESFWIDDADGAYPAIALDAAKRKVDTVTSNIGHLLGTGILDDGQAALIAKRLLSPEMSSGFGLRTMSTAAAGYWPLSYHGGSIWTHDTAIVALGLYREGFTAEADTLVDGLLAAAEGFGYRMPELHSGDPATLFNAPLPYPAACRPQAWSAAAAAAAMQIRTRA